MAWIAGVDGFKHQWFVVLRDTATGELRQRIVPNFLELTRLGEAPSIVAIDIPIGLPEIVKSGGRACERNSRFALERRRSSVFNAIGRSTLREGSQRDASAQSRAAGGIGISVQSWGLSSKLRDVDAVMTPELQSVIHEIHPEVSFWAMCGGVPMAFSKKRPEGIRDRQRALISAGLPADFIEAMGAPLRVGRDDFLDACAALWTARRILERSAGRFPAERDEDQRGLDQAIWF